MSSDDFSVDLDHLDQVTGRIEAFAELLTEHLGELDKRAGQLMQSWSGEVASAYSAAHQEWSTAAVEIRDGLHSIETAARSAHCNYGIALKGNKGMFNI